MKFFHEIHKMPKAILQKLPPMSPIKVQKPLAGPDLRAIPKKKVSFQLSYNSLMNKLETKKKEKEVEPPIVPEPIPMEECSISTTILKQEPETKPKESIGVSYFTKWEQEPILEPKTEDLEDRLIESIPIKKKDCKVYDLENNLVSYQKFRENPDHIIFYFNEIFYGYSKALLFEEYKECHQKLYFTLKLEEESLWIPMGQITRLLEYSHPIYEIEKTKFSIHLYSLKAIKLL